MTDKLQVIESELEIVKRLTGVANESRITVSETGWTSRVYLVDNGEIVFKFPRNEKFRRECRQEVSALELLKKHTFAVTTPILNWTTADNAYFGFYGVVGRPLKEIIGTLSDEQKLDIGTQLGKFLNQLHSIRDYGEVESQTPAEQVEEYLEMYQKDRALLKAYFNEAELASIDSFFNDEVPRCMAGSGDLVFCHGDLDYNNTLVDDKGRVGVIDFGDARLYDRSQDFRGIEDEILLEAMIKAYGSSEVISRGAAFATSKMIDVLNLLYCVGNRDADEENECVERIRAKFFGEAGAAQNR